MEGEVGALYLTASDPCTAVIVLNSIISIHTCTQADTHVLYAKVCLETYLYPVIHQSYVRLLLFVVSRWETAKLCPMTDLRKVWIISYFVVCFFFLCVRWPSFKTSFCPAPRRALHVFCTLFSCLSIDSSLYHLIHVFSHVAFLGKSKVELRHPQCEVFRKE